MLTLPDADNVTLPELEVLPLDDTVPERVVNPLAETDSLLETLRVPDTEPVSLTELDVECVPLTEAQDVALAKLEVLPLDDTVPEIVNKPVDDTEPVEETE